MKTNYIFLILFLLFGGFLFLSNEYDHQKNAKKIRNYQCQQILFNPFPTGFDYRDYTSSESESTTNRYSYDSLDLKSLGLRELPDSLFENYSDCITELNLYRNDFREIPPAIRHLKSLQELNLYNCNISYLKSSDDFSFDLAKLELLNLEKNNIKTLNFLPTSKHLKSVNLHNNYISAVDLPNDASTYFVKDIDLSNNKLLEFPTELLRINGIENLNLFNNEMLFIQPLDSKKLDYSINNIFLTDNNIMEFPSDFGRIKNLFTIELGGNKIGGKLELLDNSFLDLQKLKITSQYIDSVVIAPTAIPNVRTLNLFDNEISYFKADTGNIQSFISLELGQNQFTEFPADILHFKNLKSCDLSNNPIEGKVVIANCNIETLDLSNNKITSIHFSGKNKITDLNLDYNNLKSFTYDEGALSYLNNLNLGNNPNFSPTEVIALISRIQKLPTTGLKGIIRVKNNKKRVLDLSNNRIVEISFSGKNQVKELLLENNDLRNIYIKKGALKNVTLLDISNNPNLKSFPFEIFEEAPNLKTIDIIGCTGLSEQDVDKMKRLAKEYGVNYLSKGDVNYGNN